jgi:hypothetical protein
MNPDQMARLIMNYVVPLVLGLYIFFKVIMPLLSLVGDVLKMLLVILLGFLKMVANLVYRKDRRELARPEEELV